MWRMDALALDSGRLKDGRLKETQNTAGATEVMDGENNTNIQQKSTSHMRAQLHRAAFSCSMQAHHPLGTASSFYREHLFYN